jgi:probable HAF family extracellular repeat protein
MTLGWAINNRGQVIGDMYLRDVGSRAFIWADGVLSDLDVLPGGAFSSATDINERGEVMGTAANAAGQIRGVLWTRRGSK